jgi:hypothetical protein
MAPSREIARVLIRRLVRIILCVRWLTSNIRRRHRPSRRGHIVSSSYRDDFLGEVPNTADMKRLLETRDGVLDVRTLCEEYHDPSTGFLVVHYKHAGSRYKAHVRAAVDTERLLAQDPSTRPVLTPPIFARFSKVEMEGDGTDVTDVFVASAGPFRDFGGDALAPCGPLAEATIRVDDILSGEGIEFRPGTHLLIGGPDGTERVPVEGVIRFTRSAAGPPIPPVRETRGA